MSRSSVDGASVEHQWLRVKESCAFSGAFLSEPISTLQVELFN